MAYDNSTYWQTLHKQVGAKLRTVGWPNLSETFNTLKYKSEAETVLNVLKDVAGCLKARSPLKVLDVGAGTGYWTDLVNAFFTGQGFEIDLTCLDISAEALEGLKQNLPQVQTVCADLKTIAADRMANTFDMVFSFYCLHHLPRIKDFLNAIRFAGRSVAAQGYLMIMDPVLTQAYSRLDAVDFANYGGNGMARHLYLLDDVLQNEGFHRVSFRPAVSFLLNSNIQANRRFTFNVCNTLWRFLQPVYRSDRWTRWFSRLVVKADRFCKHRNMGYSSSICVYEKAA